MFDEELIERTVEEVMNAWRIVGTVMETSSKRINTE